MKRYVHTISVAIFTFNVILYLLFLNGVHFVPDEAVFPFLIIGSIIGIILPWFGGKGTIRKIGIIGNIIVLLLTFIGPLLYGVLFWNEP
ncbi:hypothetical protein [Ornithinibacillus halotolerans]|uniref:Uncharacterized protein n=1 Tax=Ornithinibacillus halotolerans TaxID=1274357 RepID=A0A916W5C2_9BACI|nr:hypothetical protein [Ornithinibacillus halotolerans]GGA67896.1 hypothetical protein GCM10008025_09680 [Ornithinibacillus halotolerans]